VAEKIVRPGSITAVVWLIAIAAVSDIVSGASLLILAGDPTTTAAVGKDPAAFQIAGWVLIGIGVLTAVIASLISKGSEMARLFVSVLMVLRVGSHVWSLIVAGLGIGSGSVIGIAIAIAILILLWGAEANTYFAAKAKPRD
jgi:hypothetical protein